jgi:hypothetical protein
MADQDYVAPSLVELGSVSEMTLGQADGDFTDKEFPVDTPKKDLTFS